MNFDKLQNFGIPSPTFRRYDIIQPSTIPIEPFCETVVSKSCKFLVGIVSCLIFRFVKRNICKECVFCHVNAPKARLSFASSIVGIAPVCCLPEVRESVIQFVDNVIDNEPFRNSEHLSMHSGS